jgi:hypothetical protein
MRTLTTVLLVLAFASVATPASATPDLASNAGCSVDCIRTALIYPSTNAAAIRVETDTPARIQVVLRKRTAMGGGDPEGLTTGAIVADRSSDGPRKVFVAFVGGLENDTLYAVGVKAVDSQGRANRRSSTFRTLRPQTIADGTGIGDLASGEGCAAQCIRTAQIEAGLRAAKLTVNMNVPARLMITAAQAEPLQTSLGPSFAHPEVDIRTNEMRTQWSGELLDLVASRRYNVIIRAIDANGRMSVRQGTFETAKRQAIVTFKRIRVHYDGDKGSNRGELAFHAKVNGYWRLERGEGKVRSNSTVHFPNGGGIGFTDLTRWIDIKVQAVERDKTGTCFDYVGSGPFPELSGSTKKNCVKRTWNTAHGQFDLDEVFAQDALLPGFGGWSSFDKTIYATRGPIRFEVELGFEVFS